MEDVREFRVGLERMEAMRDDGDGSETVSLRRS